MNSINSELFTITSYLYEILVLVYEIKPLRLRLHRTNFQCSLRGKTPSRLQQNQNIIYYTRLEDIFTINEFDLIIATNTLALPGKRMNCPKLFSDII